MIHTPKKSIDVSFLAHLGALHGICEVFVVGNEHQDLRGKRRVLENTTHVTLDLPVHRFRLQGTAESHLSIVLFLREVWNGITFVRSFVWPYRSDIE